MIQPSAKIYRIPSIGGFMVPAFIHNGGYNFVDIEIYEDGRIDCWHFEDFEHFRSDVQRGWVAVNVPDDSEVSIHGLGSLKISTGLWQFNAGSFIEYAQNLIRKINPNFENILAYRKKFEDGLEVIERANGIIYKEDYKASGDHDSTKIKGSGFNLFYKMDNNFHLVKVNIYEDGTLQLSRLEHPVDLDVKELETLISKKLLLTKIPEGAIVNIHGLGTVKVQKVYISVSIKDKLLELKDIQRHLQGEPTTIELCRRIYRSYLDNPTDDNKQALKSSYENVPRHHRIFVGDMDTKDNAIRRIIYEKK